MDRKTLSGPLVLSSLALLGLAGPALAAAPVNEGIDAIATAELSASADSGDAGPEARNRRGNRGSTKASRPGSTTRTTTTRTSTTASRPGTGPVHSTTTTHSATSSSARTIVHPTPGRPGRTVVHTTPARPGRTVVHTTPARPGHTVVHTTPARPGHTVVHTAPPPHVYHAPPPPVVHSVRPVAVRTVTYTHVHPYHGVFVYGPRPVTHVQYVHERGPVQVERRDLPKREVNRNDTIAVGLKGGTLISGAPEGGIYGDPGLGLMGRYRPDESVGLELALSHHGMTIDPLNARSQTQVAGSVELFAYPWTRVSPYVIAGVTWNGGSVTDDVWMGDTYVAATDVSSQLGLHGGLGVELAMGKSVALDFEGRYIGWVSDSTPDMPSAPGALQATGGLVVHFK
jgi:hypothetical protein